ncbi:hypothetical protein MUP59_00150 [Candidatus Bathyarchaeota archaeon]|nr:hypothetical protein [Candidatus Bathyarchaeota archaeon]
MGFKKMERWRKVEIAQSIFALLIVSLLVSTSFYYIWASTAPHESTVKAIKLKVASGAPPGSKVTMVVPIRIWAVDDENRIDKSRTDVVAIEMPPSRILRLRETQVSLIAGEGTVEADVVAAGQENLLITVVWVKGESYLKPGTFLLVYPPVAASI